MLTYSSVLPPPIRLNFENCLLCLFALVLYSTGFSPSEFYFYLFYLVCSLMLLRANEKSRSLGLAMNGV